MATAAPPSPSSSSSSVQQQQQQQHSSVVCKPRPLMLKDYLREDQNSDSFSRSSPTPPTSRWCAAAASSSANTVRYLLTLELNNGTTAKENRKASIGHKPHNGVGCSGGTNSNPLARLSAVINALKMLPFSNSSSGSRGALTCGAASRKQQGGMAGLPRSLSKRLRRSFWKKCAADERGNERGTGPCSELASRRVLVRDIVRRASLDDDRIGWGHKAMTATTTTTTTTTTTNLPLPSSSPLKAKQQTGPATTTSTAGSSPARASCSTSTSLSISASSWSELDSDSSSRSGSESVGSSSSPVPEFGEPVVKPAAERKSVVVDNGAPGSPARTICGGGRAVEVPAPTPAAHRYAPEVQGSDDGNGDSGMRFTCAQYEEKDQLSPVAVVDFPSSSSDEENDDDDGSTSRSDGTQSTVGADEEEDAEEATAAGAFHQRLASIERVKHRLMWKIQKFETLVDLVDPATGAFDAESVVDGADTDEDEEDEEEATTTWTDHGVEAQAKELLERLKATSAAAGNGGWGPSYYDHEALLMDLFINGLWEHEERARTSSSWRCRRGVAETATSRCIGDGDDDDVRRRVEDGLLSAARDWLQATPLRRRRGVARVEVGTKEELIRELDRDGPWGRRCCFDAEEAEVAAGIADGILDSLLAETLFGMLMMTSCVRGA